MAVPVVSLYNMAGEVVGEVQLADDVFGVQVNPALLHQAVVTRLANERVGTAATKTRAEVSGGGRKPWRQKGTGRARQGSIRAPHWRGGGVVFGPQPRDYRLGLPRKARRLALKGALSSKVAEGTIRVLDGLSFERPRTRELLAVLSNLRLEGRKALVVTAAPDENVYKSARNLPGVQALPATDLNAYDVLNHEGLVITRQAVEKLQEVLGR